MTEGKKFGLRRLEIDDEAACILAYAVDGGQILDTDAAWIWKRFEDAKADGKKVRVYAEMQAMPRVHAGVILDKLKRFGTLLRTLDRIAVVGDQGWLDIYAKIADPITRFDIRHFTIDQRQQAIDWLRS